MMTQGQLAFALVLAIASFVSGMRFESWNSQPSTERVLADAKPMPGRTLADGSVVAPKSAVTPDARPRHDVPRGARVDRVSSVTVVPSPVVCSTGEVVQCPPITVDATTATENGTTRMIFKSYDGTITESSDTPTRYLIEDKRLWRPYLLAVDDGTGGVKPGAAVARDVGVLSVLAVGAEGFAAVGVGIPF